MDIYHKDNPVTGIKVHKIAVSAGNELVLVGIIVDATKMKQIRALLACGQRLSVNVAGVNANNKTYKYHRPRSSFSAVMSDDGYHIHTHRIGYGLVHALLLSKSPGFMVSVTRDALWAELRSPRFTTPVLPEWVEYLEKDLRQMGHLQDATCQGCECGTLSVTTNKLDAIVAEGLRNRDLLIQ
jgi:hypothetical protein